MRTKKGPKSSEDGGLYAALLRYLDDAPNWGHAKADEMTSEDSKRRDPMRHMLASSEVVQELKNDRGFSGPGAALAANVLGLGHELQNFHGVRSMGEDLLNNFIGSIPAAVLDDPEKIDQMINMLSYFTPDGKDESEDDYDGGGKLKGEKEEDEREFDENAFMRGVRFVESRDGKYMINPTSSATGYYGQLYKQIEDYLRDAYDIDTREEFAENYGVQDQIFGDRMYGRLPGMGSGLIDSAFDLTDEYSPQLENFNYTPDEVAALVNFMGRQGTRKYFASLRDGTEYAVPGVNKTPEAYLDLYREAVQRYRDSESKEHGGRMKVLKTAKHGMRLKKCY